MTSLLTKTEMCLEVLAIFCNVEFYTKSLARSYMSHVGRKTHSGILIGVFLQLFFVNASKTLSLGNFYHVLRVF